MGFTPKFPNESEITASSEVITKPKEEVPFVKSFISEITIDASGLPSLGKPYPIGAKIKYRPFIFGEVKKISSSVNLSQRDMFEIILNGIEASFDKYSLTLNDMLYLGILRKVSTLGTSKFSVEFSCNNCNKANKLVLSSTDFDFDELKASKLPVIAQVRGVDFKFTPLTIKDFFDIVDSRKEEDEIYAFAKQCRNMPVSQAYEYIFNCNPEEATIFDKVDRFLTHKLKPLSIKCKHCEADVHVSLDGGQALILPFRESGEPLGDRIRFGDEDEH